MANFSKVYIVLLNFNSYEDTSDCLSSIRDCSYKNLSVIVIDNASKDDSLHRLREQFDECIFIESKNNLGFAGGCNLGLKYALENGCDYALLLNNDTVVKPDFVEHLIEIAEQKDNVGLVGGKIYFHGSSDRVWDAGGKAKLWKGQCTRIVPEKSNISIINEERKVDFVTGCLMLIPRQVLLQVGFLPECYFFGVEEWDYGFSVRKSGYDLWYTPKALIWHKVGGSHSDINPVFYYNFLRGRMLFMKRNAKKETYFLWMLIFAIYSFLVKPFLYGRIYKNRYHILIATRQAFMDNYKYSLIKQSHLAKLGLKLDR